MYDGFYHTPLGRISTVDISTAVGIVPVPKEVGIRNVSPRAFRKRIVRYWLPLGCRAIELETPLQGGVIHNVVPVYGYLVPGTAGTAPIRRDILLKGGPITAFTSS